MKKTIFLSAGHSFSQPGAVYSGLREAELTIGVRNALFPLLMEQGFEVYCPPDYLDLRGSIDWVNKIAKDLNDGYCLEIHCNAGGRSGAEIFYYAGDNKSKSLTDKIINSFCAKTGIINRGSKPDTNAAVGSLGWIRKTNTWAGLLEIGYMDNPNDLNKIKNYQLMAQGVCNGLLELFK